MKKFMLCLVLTGIVSFPLSSYSLTFSDNFDDGDLAGWTPKQGAWSNPSTYMQSSHDNYGIIWKDGTHGFKQSLQIDAYYDSVNSFTKSAQLRLRSGNGGGGNPFFDHGYYASISNNHVTISNAVQPGYQHLLGSVSLTLVSDQWRTLAFSVEGFGTQTNLKFWADGILVLDVFDTSGHEHDDGGYVALGSSNHINTRINYDNFSATVDEASVPEPTSIIMLISALIGMFGFRNRLGL